MINNDYIDSFVNGFVVRQQHNERQAEAREHRLIKEYRAAHPELRARYRVARVLRRVADRLSPEPAPRPRFRVVGSQVSPSR
jgi:hypothetical protein